MKNKNHDIGFQTIFIQIAASIILAICLLENGCVWYKSCDLAPSMTGNVLDKTSGKRIAGARVTYRTNYAPYVETAVTDEDGRFELGGMTSRNVYIVLPFFAFQIPQSEYMASDTESPACYVKVEKSGYLFFSTVLKSQYVDGCRELALFRDLRPIEETQTSPNEKKTFRNMYDNISLSSQNNVIIYLQKISKGNPK